MGLKIVDMSLLSKSRTRRAWRCGAYKFAVYQSLLFTNWFTI